MSINKKVINICLSLLFIVFFGCSINVNQNKSDTKLQAYSADNVPDYVKTEAKRVSDLIRAAQNSNTFTIIGVSDLHYLKGNSQIDNAITDMALGVKEISAQIPVDYKIAFGDYIFRKSGYENYDDGVVEMEAATNLLNTAFGEKGKQIRLTGNHDINSMELDNGELKKYFTTRDIYRYVGKYHDKRTVTDSVNPECNYGYIDIPEKKIRIIYLNTSDFTDEQKPPVKPNPKDINKNTEYTYNMSKRQVAWFIEALKLTGIKDTENWNILIISHIDLTGKRLRSNMKGNAAVLLAEYVKKHKGTLKIKGSKLPYDYSDIKPARILPYIHGHNHDFSVDDIKLKNAFKGITRNEMITIGIPNACPLRNGKSNTYYKKKGTEKSTSFNVIVIDLEQSIVNVFCYGAGFDRIIHFDGLKMKELSSNINLHTVLKGKVTWTSQKNNIVQVSDGEIKPVSVGNTLVVAEDENGNCEYWDITVQ